MFNPGGFDLVKHNVLNLLDMFRHLKNQVGCNCCCPRGVLFEFVFRFLAHFADIKTPSPFSRRGIF
jgi:hypothetical protein